MNKAGLIGLGAMGAGIAATLRERGYEMHVCDARPGAAVRFAEAGGVAWATPAQVAHRCEVVISVVVNAAQTEAVLFGEGGDLAGALRHPAALNNAGAGALLVHAGPGASKHLELVRELLVVGNTPVRCAATCVNGILLVRWLAAESIDIRPSFARVWTALRAAARNLSPTLPTFWHH